MSDISKCANDTCPLRKDCYRFTAPPGYWQLYNAYQHKDGKCDDFRSNKNHKTKP